MPFYRRVNKVPLFRFAAALPRFAHARLAVETVGRFRSALRFSRFHDANPAIRFFDSLKQHGAAPKGGTVLFSVSKNQSCIPFLFLFSKRRAGPCVPPKKGGVRCTLHGVLFLFFAGKKRNQKKPAKGNGFMALPLGTPTLPAVGASHCFTPLASGEQGHLSPSIGRASPLRSRAACGGNCRLVP